MPTLIWRRLRGNRNLTATVYYDGDLPKQLHGELARFEISPEHYKLPIASLCLHYPFEELQEEKTKEEKKGK